MDQKYILVLKARGTNGFTGTHPSLLFIFLILKILTMADIIILRFTTKLHPVQDGEPFQLFNYL